MTDREKALAEIQRLGQEYEMDEPTDMLAKVGRAIAAADERNGGPPYEMRIKNKHSREMLFDEAQAAIEAHEKALEAQGLVIVPREPTDEMLDSYWTQAMGRGGKKAVWQAMLAALEGKGMSEDWCAGQVPEGGRGVGFYQCSRKGRVEEGGQWWCYQHAPAAVKKRQEECGRRYDEKWQAEVDARQNAKNKIWNIAIEAAAEWLESQEGHGSHNRLQYAHGIRKLKK